ncbi:hypothetical protein JRO89_XS01G0313200 [Xanthoceras sorbifolium]|uniref:Uncharacterized protein n=1 Tax=Xanthoceras sorbifolium TaxID=99658 RepID=A0ABQ8IMF6_9ROSI|nr:hypothetical protein JRO89_XS01G0313200 [Xanthoceras sorbifolium]
MGVRSAPQSSSCNCRCAYVTPLPARINNFQSLNTQIKKKKNFAKISKFKNPNVQKTLQKPKIYLVFVLFSVLEYMALNDPTKTLETRVETRGSECGSGESDCEEVELEKLESDVKQMAQKILEYRTTLPDQLKNTFALILSAQRPALPGIEFVSEPGPSGEHNTASVALPSLLVLRLLFHFVIKGSNQSYSYYSDSGGHVESKGTTLVSEEQKTADKILLLKEKISSNVSAMPIVLKRVKECIYKIDKLDSYNGIIHPAFKKKKPS